jgi:hypothetical protein
LELSETPSKVRSTYTHFYRYRLEKKTLTLRIYQDRSSLSYIKSLFGIALAIVFFLSKKASKYYFLKKQLFLTSSHQNDPKILKKELKKIKFWVNNVMVVIPNAF